MSETIEDVVKSLRDRAEGRRKSGKLLQIDDKMFDLLADRIEAAHKREVAVSKMEATTPTCKDSLQVGDAAKYKEALSQIAYIVRMFDDIDNVRRRVKTVLKNLKAQGGGAE
jgi:chorismate mutase